MHLMNNPIHNPLASEPRQFRNGTWSCCARTHARPDTVPALTRAYDLLMPHVTEWEDVVDPTTEILFGVGPLTVEQQDILAATNAALVKGHKQQNYRK